MTTKVKTLGLASLALVAVLALALTLGVGPAVAVEMDVPMFNWDGFFAPIRGGGWGDVIA